MCDLFQTSEEDSELESDPIDSESDILVEFDVSHEMIPQEIRSRI